MGATASSRGWPIHSKDGEWVMDDTGMPDDGILPCKQCGKHPAEDEHDPCIVNLPGVRNACCGHGDTEPYISFVGLPRVTLRGQPAIVVMKALGGNPPCWDGEESVSVKGEHIKEREAARMSNARLDAIVRFRAIDPDTDFSPLTLELRRALVAERAYVTKQDATIATLEELMSDREGDLKFEYARAEAAEEALELADALSDAASWAMPHMTHHTTILGKVMVVISWEHEDGMGEFIDGEAAPHE